MRELDDYRGICRDSAAKIEVASKPKRVLTTTNHAMI